MPIYKEFVKLIVDFSTIIIIFIIDIVIDYNPFGVERGFFPNDESLMHPLKKETVNYLYLLLLSSIVPAIVMVIVELSLAYCYRRSSKIQLAGNLFIPSFVYDIIRNVMFHWLILVTTFLVTDVLKFRIGRLRPHFLTVCDLDMSKINDTNVFLDNASLCRGSKDAISVARQSFPSGHSAMSMCAATSLIIFLYRKLWERFPMLRFPLQVLSLGLLALVAYVATSRLIDYWHHPLDVVGGAIVGFVVTILLCRYKSNCYISSENLGNSVKEHF